MREREGERDGNEEEELGERVFVQHKAIAKPKKKRKRVIIQVNSK